MAIITITVPLESLEAFYAYKMQNIVKGLNPLQCSAFKCDQIFIQVLKLDTEEKTAKQIIQKIYTSLFI